MARRELSSRIRALEACAPATKGLNLRLATDEELERMEAIFAEHDATTAKDLPAAAQQELDAIVRRVVGRTRDIGGSA